jgi:hypothetical protein
LRRLDVALYSLKKWCGASRSCKGISVSPREFFIRILVINELETNFWTFCDCLKQYLPLGRIGLNLDAVSACVVSSPNASRKGILLLE